MALPGNVFAQSTREVGASRDAGSPSRTESRCHAPPRAGLFDYGKAHARFDPGLDTFMLLRDELARVESQPISPTRLLFEAREMAQEFARAIPGAPADVRRALRQVANGDLVRVRTPELEAIGRLTRRAIEGLTGRCIGCALYRWRPARDRRRVARSAGDVLLALGTIGTLATGLEAVRRSARHFERTDASD